MTLVRRPVVAVFLGWTLLIWATRLRNIWADGDVFGSPRNVGNLALAIAFVLVALWVVRIAWRRPLSQAKQALDVLVALTLVVWPFRLVAILLGDWSVGFKVVHSILAFITMGLAVLASRRTGAADERRRPATNTTP